MSYFKKSCFILSLAVLAGCANNGVGGHSVEPQQASGSEAGKLVVFALDNLAGETVGVSLNNQFIAPLQANKQFTQSICSGAYHVEARSVNPQSMGKRVVREKAQQFVQIAPQHTTYLEVLRAGNDWAVREVTPEEWQMKSVSLESGEAGKDSKIVRRLTSAMLNCK